MISAEDLTKCIDNLAEINARFGTSDSALKRLTLEVGYILKQELETVMAWDEQVQKDHNRGFGKIDIKKLLEDNTQLYNENRKLQELNLKLKEVIDHRIPKVEESISSINEKFDVFSEILAKS